MSDQNRDGNHPAVERSEDDYVKGGKGRKDEFQGSRIYPASAPDAPRDAEVRTVGDFVKHRSPVSKRPKGFKRAI